MNGLSGQLRLEWTNCLQRKQRKPSEKPEILKPLKALEDNANEIGKARSK